MQVVLLILGCFSFCWLPYFIVACIQIFSLIDHSSPVLYKCAFSLAMANSGMNPIIYAWKNKNFRLAFGLLLRCKNPDIAYRNDCHFPSNRQRRGGDDAPNATATKRNGRCGNKPIATITSGSASSSASSDRESHCSSHEDHGEQDAVSADSHSVVVMDQIIVPVRGQGMLTREMVEGRRYEEIVPECRRHCPTSGGDSMESSGTEITDDSSDR